MYEPYEEKKESRVKEFFKRLRERVQSPVKNTSFERIKSAKLPAVLLLVAVLAIGGLSYTGYTAYTSRVSETQSQLMIKDRQINALNEDLDVYKTSLAVCESNLENKKESLDKTETSLKETENRLFTCTTEFTQLINATAGTQAAYTQLQSDYDGLQTNYKSLECSYAKSEECNYYTFSGSQIQCCGKIDDKFYCGPQFVPTNSSDVKQVSEYCG